MQLHVCITEKEAKPIQKVKLTVLKISGDLIIQLCPEKLFKTSPEGTPIKFDDNELRIDWKSLKWRNLIRVGTKKVHFGLVKVLLRIWRNQ